MESIFSFQLLNAACHISMIHNFNTIKPFSTALSKKFFKRKNIRFGMMGLFTLPILGGGIFMIKQKYKNHSIQTQASCIQLSIHDKQWKSKSVLQRFYRYSIRLIQLMVIFFPSMILLPLFFFSWTRNFWLSVFLSRIEAAGVIWIKIFQYLSHRRDVIGPQMAQKFSVLWQNSPKHSLQYTKTIFKSIYNCLPAEYFDSFNPQPIASGSVSQVYEAIFKGNKVAVKIRHPLIQSNIQIDIDLLFMISSFLAKLSKKFQIPSTSTSLKKMLGEQIYFTQEKRNLEQFSRIFTNSRVKFPKTYQQTTDQVLIQEFIEGKPIVYYLKNDHQLRRGIAMIGALTFFQMLMQHNFVHADCHGGNIMVNFTGKNQYAWVTDSLQSLWNLIIYQVQKISIKSKVLEKLSWENYLYHKQVSKIMKQSNFNMQVILIDAGMVIRLNQQKKSDFKDFLAEVIKGDPNGCAKKIYGISKYDGQCLEQGQYPEYFKDLEDMFQILKKYDLADLQGIEVLNGMLGVLRVHNMKIDGQISILMTNMLVLEAISKELDPSLNILRCAVPFLHKQ